MAVVLTRALCPFGRTGSSLLRLSKPSAVFSRSIIKRPPFIQKLYDKMDAIEHSIDEEANIGANLPFSIENPRRLAIKFILFIGIAFNIPFFVTYYQMKAAKSGIAMNVGGGWCCSFVGGGGRWMKCKLSEAFEGTRATRAFAGTVMGRIGVGV
ncbi:hypothetical protein EGR_02760 [Echinococcus granulosus]|uniref:Uncharacterized protein n=1 Tax=Echinococcus granulosus TaxID=6210 RepID=W6UV86_ECHGR|nr:hypothetical protein EGR_02760 [Echinococcus granulosus]EUB62307.1 hypothetical protein EGR_02760 [Echinococcus granulosus]